MCLTHGPYSNTIKAIQDIMRKGVGGGGGDADAQRIGQLAWMLFLKIWDDREAPMRIEEFEIEKAWWTDRKETDQAWTYMAQNSSGTSASMPRDHKGNASSSPTSRRTKAHRRQSRRAAGPL